MPIHGNTLIRKIELQELTVLMLLINCVICGDEQFSAVAEISQRQSLTNLAVARPLWADVGRCGRSHTHRAEIHPNLGPKIRPLSMALIDISQAADLLMSKK